MITDKPSGSIKRLTVAVVVDGIYNKTTGAKEAFSPRSEEELKRLRDLVSNSVGIDDSRRDSISISSLPFHINEFLPVDEAPMGPWYQRPDFVKPLIRNVLLGLGALLFLFFFVRPMLKWVGSKPEPKETTAPPVLPRTVAEIEAANKEEGLLALTRSTGLLEEVEPLEKKEEAELRKRIAERLEASPKKGFRIVQDWLEEEAAVPVPLTEARHKKIMINRQKKSQLSGIEKTAILMNVLGREKSFELMKSMKDTDVRKLLKVMGNMKKAPIHLINSVLREFLYRLSEKEEIIFEEDLAEPDLVSQGLGEERAKQIFGTLKTVNLVERKQLPRLIHRHENSYGVFGRGASPDYRSSRRTSGAEQANSHIQAVSRLDSS